MSAGGWPIAGLYQSSPPSLSNGDSQRVLVDSSGRVLVALGPTSAAADNTANPTAAASLAYMHGLRESTAQWDRVRVLTPAATFTSAPVAALASVSFPVLWDGVSAVWRRARGDSVGAAVIAGQKPAITSTEDLTTLTGDRVTTKVFKSSAGNLFSVLASNGSGADAWFMLFNKAIAPVNTDVPVSVSIFLPTKSSIAFGSEIFGIQGKYFSTGIASAWSTQEGTLNLVGAGAGLGATLHYS